MKAMVIFTVAVVFFLAPSAVNPSFGQGYWQSKDFEKSFEILNSITKITLTRESTLFVKPPFYDGPMPLQFKEVCLNLYSGMGGSEQVVVIRDFGDWHNLFLYPNKKAVFFKKPAGAVTVDNKTNYKIAECILLRTISKEKRIAGYEIEEIHYNKAEVMFRAKFQVDFHLGNKIKEYDTIGEKKKDYYFLWVSRF
jgi:hypothetical protein